MTSIVFETPYNEDLIHQLVVAYLAGGRAGTKAQKTRSEVRGGGKKPWRQKGTGRARAGTIRSPIWRSGGVTFAAKPRSYQQKLNKKMYKVGMRSILSELNRNELIRIVDDFKVDAIKTKNIVEKLKELHVNNALIVTDLVDENLFLSARNIANIEIIDVNAINPVALLKYKQVIITKNAVKQIEELFA